MRRRGSRALSPSLSAAREPHAKERTNVREIPFVVFYKEYDAEPDPQDENDDGKRRVARHSSVFNVTQVEGFALAQTPATSIVERDM